MVEQTLQETISRMDNDPYTDKAMLFSLATFLRALLRQIDRDEKNHAAI